MVNGNRRRDGFLDIPWVAIAAAAGVIVVVICAALFFMGGNGDPTGITTPVSTGTPSSPGPSVTHHVVTPSSGQPGKLTYNVALTGYEPDSIPVPDKGTFIKVIYRGGYDGTYTSGSGPQELRNSGERVIEIENPGTTVTATVKKQESSTSRH